MNGRGPTPRVDPDQWVRVEALFHQALELDPGARSVFLDGACGDDPEVRLLVDRLVAADAEEGAMVDDSLETLAGLLLADPETVGGPSAEAVTELLASGTRVGRYRILDVLGSGGMGTVYEAERADGDHERKVALKMVRRGRLRGAAEAHFQRERQILARLSHPGIATLLDGGVTPDGLGYLAMEYIDGRPITAYAEDHALDRRARIALLTQVTGAVGYAHRNLVVHQDLKPSNILVDATGRVVLVDFGIARLTDDADARAGESALLTPDYAAPEQIRGGPITTATDVHAIGAVLYELLTGRRPFGKVGRGWPGLRRVLEDVPPALSANPEEGSASGRHGSMSFDADIEAIVRRALAKAPEHRYANAGELHADLEDYLAFRPVSARPSSFLDRLSKLVRRNRLAAAATNALVVALGLGVTGTLWQAREARLQAERGEAVGDFLFSLFDGADPDLNPGEPVTAIELLEAGLARVDSLRAGPEVRVDLLTTLGVLFDKLGHYERSSVLLRSAVEEARATLPGRDPGLADALHGLGVHLASLGDLEEAEHVLREARTARERGAAGPAERAATEGALALTLRRRGQYDEAEALYGTAIARLAGEAPVDTLALASELMGLAQVYQFVDRMDDAESLFRAVRRTRETSGITDPTLAHAIHNLGVVLAGQERHEEAERTHREALSLWTRLFPRGHPEIARSHEALARVVERQGQWTEADSLYDAAIAGWSHLYGDDHTQIAAIRANQANLRYFAGDFDAAAEAYRDGVRIWRANDERRLLGTALRNLGVIERERGDLTAADTLLAAALEVRRALNGDEDASVAEVHSAIAGLRNAEGRHAEAESHARTAVEQFGALLEPGHRLTMNASLQLGVALAAQQRYEDARPVLEPVLARFRETLNPADAQLGRAGLWLGVALAGQGETERALSLIAEALPILEAGLGADAPETLRASRAITRLR